MYLCRLGDSSSGVPPRELAQITINIKAILIRKHQSEADILAAFQSRVMAVKKQRMTRRQEDYARRLQGVAEYIDSHLDEDLSAARLCQMAGFSRFHFHRQFLHFFGMTVFRRVQTQRLRRAAKALVTSDLAVIEVALEAGFESPEAFARVFKKAFSQTPSQFRRDPQCFPWLEPFPFSELMGTKAMNVTISEFSETPLAVLEHRKSPALVDETVQTFIAWRKSVGQHPDTSRSFGIIYDDPDNTPPEAFRFDLCGELGGKVAEVADNPYGVKEGLLAGGRCAVVRHLGPLDNIGDSVRFLYGKWLPESGESLRDAPCFFHYVKLPSQVNESELVTDIYLPIEG